MSRRTKKRPRTKVKAKVIATPVNQATVQLPRYPIFGDWWPTTKNAPRVTHDNAVTISTVWCCLRVISDTLAALPWRTMRRDETGNQFRETTHVVDWLLHWQSNPETPAFRFKRLMGVWAASWGNAYAEIERDRAGRPVWLWPIAPDRVDPYRDEAGELWYEVHNPSKASTFLHYRDMLHFRGMGFDDFEGADVIRLAAQSIGLAMAMEDDAVGYWNNHPSLHGFLEHPGNIGEAANERVRTSFQKMFKMAIALLEEGMKYHPIAMNARDQQFEENRKLSVLEICRFFRVPPHKVMDYSRATWSNAEQAEQEFINDTMVPWTLEFEGEANLKLFGLQQRGRLFTKFNFNARLRGDSQQRSEFYGKMSDLGVFDIDEIREREDLNQIGELGKLRLVQINRQTLEQAAKEPEPAPPPAAPAQPSEETPPTPDDGAQPEDKLAQARRIMGPVVYDACWRVARRAVNRYHDVGAKKTNCDKDYQAWRAQIAEQQGAYAIEVMRPIAAALAELAGSPLNGSLESVLAVYGNELNERTFSWMDCPTDLTDDQEVANREAAKFLDSILAAVAAAKGAR